jgi:hypothetical protein
MSRSLRAATWAGNSPRVRAAVPKNIPIWPFSTDINGSAALVRAVIPLDEICFDNSLRTETSQLARATRALSRTHQDRCEVDARQTCPQFARLGFAMHGQRNICRAGCCPVSAHSVPP